MSYLTAAAFLGTVDMNTANSMNENIDFISDNVLLNIVLLLACLMFLYSLCLLLKKCPVAVFTAVMLVFTAVFGITWILNVIACPTHDSFIVTLAGENAAYGDYSSFTDNDYFRYFPFQLGYVLYTEILIRLFKDTDVLIQIVNLLFLLIAYFALMRIAAKLFSERAQKLTAILLALCLPGVLFCTFQYGIIPGFAFAMLAVWMIVEYMDSRRLRYLILYAVFIACSVSLKPNYAIVLIATAAIAAVFILKEKKPSGIAGLALAVALTLCLNNIPRLQYEKRTGVDFGNGIPLTSWAAMGLSDAEIAPGWYTYQYTRGNFIENGMDYDLASKASVKVIKQRLSEFKADKGLFLSFFSEKVRSQWNEPTYQSLWTNQVRSLPENRGFPAAYMCGDGEYSVKGFMNYYQQLIFFGTLLSALFCMRKKDLGVSIFLLTIFGGFLYHFIFEAKSQYSLYYFIMMVPLAAYGLDSLFNLPLPQKLMELNKKHA